MVSHEHFVTNHLRAVVDQMLWQDGDEDVLPAKRVSQKIAGVAGRCQRAKVTGGKLGG